jgi:pyruvate dehydrogenase E1 component beta subunit
MFIEHLLLYSSTGVIPKARYEIPLGLADVKREGTHVSLITYSRMTNVALEAAEKLSSQGVSVEVIDLRCLRPFDMNTVLQSVRKTHRVLVLEEAWRTCGFGAEIAANIQEQAFDYLDAPISRIGGVEIPMPYSKPLEQAAIPDSNKVIDTILAMMNS